MLYQHSLTSPHLPVPNISGPNRETHLETIEADDTLAMGDVVICENFLPFLTGEKMLLKHADRELCSKPVHF
jgi:hypothetical protein